MMRNDDMIQLSQEIKQIIRNLQEEKYKEKQARERIC